MRRHGFSLVELVVVLAIFGVLTALLLAGVQRVRAAAAQAACGNNLRQLALAAHAHHATHSRLPPGIGGRKDPYPLMGWVARLLPHLDQQPAWDEAVADFARTDRFDGPPPHRNLGRPLAVAVCPADGRAVGTTDEDVTAGFGHYLGLSGSSFGVQNGVLFRDSAVRLADVTDGTANTLLAGERPPSADFHFGWWYAGIGMADWNGSADMVLSAEERNYTFRAPTCPPGPYSFRPGHPDDMCSTFHFWSRHPGGANFAFTDGSVRFLRYPAAPVLPALATRNGGESGISLPD